MPSTFIPNSPETAGGLDIVAACPECGGGNSWRLLQTLRLCGYCGSALWWPRDPGRPGFLVAEDATERPEALLDVLQTLDAMRERSRLVGLRANSERANGKIPIDGSDDPTVPSVEDLKAERRHLFALDADYKVLAPYVLISSTLAFHALGRPRSGGLKKFRNLFFQLEEIAPAYPPPWNFRDRGLWVAKQRLRPFAPGDFAFRPIPRRDDAVRPERLAARWRKQRLLILSDLEPISFDSSLIAPSPWCVFRPFHYVRARTPMGDGWFLVDGQFGNVAGYPDPDEVRRATARDWKPLDTREIRAAGARAIGFRCPDCGADVPLVERTELQLCGHCGRLLALSPDGLTTHPYSIVDRASIPWWPDRGHADVAWLPFFRVELSVTREETRLFAEWPECWIPGFEALNVGRYDAWAFEWAGALTRIRPERCERRFYLEEPVEKANRVLPAAIRWETLRPLLPHLLLELLPKPAQARLNPMVLEKVFASTFDVSKVSVVFVPAPVTTDSERRVLGPTSSVGWVPLRDGKWPPDLQRDIRRALERGKKIAEPQDAGDALSTWMEKRPSS